MRIKEVSKIGLNFVQSIDSARFYEQVFERDTKWSHPELIDIKSQKIGIL